MPVYQFDLNIHWHLIRARIKNIRNGDFEISQRSKQKKMSNKFDDFLAEQLKDPELNKEYDGLEPKYALIESIVMARKEKNLTQKELSKLTGITQADLSKIENVNANPSLNTLLKLAKGLGKKLQFSLV